VEVPLPRGLHPPRSKVSPGSCQSELDHVNTRMVPMNNRHLDFNDSFLAYSSLHLGVPIFLGCCF
jgi:hypothetical protein